MSLRKLTRIARKWPEVVDTRREKEKPNKRMKVQNGGNDSSSGDGSSTPDNEWMDLRKPGQYNKKQCSYCKRTFYRAADLQRHVTKNCLKNPEALCNLKENQSHRCNNCGRLYQHAKSLTHHLRHECQRKVACPHCGLELIGGTVTQRHLKICKANTRGKTELPSSPVSISSTESN